MLCKRRRTAAQKRIRRYIAVILVITVICVVYFEAAVRVQLSEVIRTQLRSAAHQAINSAVLDFLADNPDVGENLTDLSFSGSGAVSAVTTDPSYINFAKAEISSRAADKIDRLTGDQGLDIPLGSFSGIILLNEYGPCIKLRIGSFQTVSCTFESTFTSAGVNQTLHHITLYVDVSVTVSSPFRIYKPVKIRSDFEIAQTVIVGAVPSYGGVLTY